VAKAAAQLREQEVAEEMEEQQESESEEEEEEEIQGTELGAKKERKDLENKVERFEQKLKILSLEKELERARLQLGEINKAEYAGNKSK
jgi:hypothetical protein